MAEIGQKSKNVDFTTGNEWKNQRGIKFPRCFYHGLLSEFFFRGILFSLLNLMIKPYQMHIECWEGLCQFSCIKIRTLNDVSVVYLSNRNIGRYLHSIVLL